MDNKDQNTNVPAVSDSAGVQPAWSGIGGVTPEPADVQDLALDPMALPREDLPPPPQKRDNVVLRLLRRADVALIILLVVGSVGLVVGTTLKKAHTSKTNSIADQYKTTQIPLSGFIANEQGVSFGTSKVQINGVLDLSSGLVISPSVQPNHPTSGQLYFDQNTDQLAYYNGTTFVPLSGNTEPVVQSIDGVTGDITLGGGLSVVGNQLVSATGVTSIGGTTGDVAVGNGLVISGNSLQNSGVLSLASGTPANLTVTSDGNGNFTISNVGAGSGTVTSGGGTNGNIALFTGSQNIENSILSQSGSTVTVGGSLSVTGGLTLSSPLSVANGGTGANTLASNGVLVGNGGSAISSVTAGGAGLCLLSTAGVPTWAACPGGGGSSVTSLNGLTGALTIANASAAGSTVTINDASTAAKGIASFNATNFTVTSGAVNTVQDINATATPTFGRLTVTSSQAASSMLVVNNTNGAASGNLVDLQLGGASKFSVQPNGNTTLTGTLAVNGSSATVGVANSQTGSLVLAYGSANFSGTITQGALTGARTYTLPDATGTICLTSGNCLGGGGTGGANAALSNLASVAINTTLLPGAAGTINLGSGTLPFGDAFLGGTSGTPGTNNFRITGVSTGGTRVITLPDAGGTVCLQSAAACGFAPSSGSTNYIQNQIASTQTADFKISGTGTLGTLVATGSATLQGGSITLGTNAQAGSVIISDGSSNTGTIQTAALGQNTVYTLPDPGGATATLCLTTGNCAGTGGGVTGSGTNNHVAKFTGTGSAIGDSIITDDGTTVAATGNLSLSTGHTYQINGIQIASSDLSNDSNLAKLNANQTFTGGTNTFQNGANSTNAFNVQNAGGSTILTIDSTNGKVILGKASTLAGTLVFQNATNANIATLQTAALGQNTVYTIPDPATGSATFCLSTGNCLGGGGGANTALSNLASVAINTTLLPGAAGTINLGSGTLPFGDVFLAGTSGTPGTNNFKITGTSTSGTRVITLPDATGTVCLQSAAACGFAPSSGSANYIQNQTASTQTADFKISGTGTLGTLLATGSGTLQGGSITLGTNAQAGSVIINDGSSNTGTVQTAALAQNTVYTLPDPGAGTATICLTTGNCSGVGGGVTGSGTDTHLAKFNGTGSAIGDSTLTDNGTTLTSSDNLVIQGGSITTGVANTQTGSLVLADGGSAFSGTITQGALTGAHTYTLPDATGTVCLQSAAACGFAPSSGSGNYIQNQTASTQTADFKISGTGTLGTLVATGSGTLQGGSITLGTNAQAGSVIINDGSSNTGTLQTAALGQNTVYTLPDPGSGTATICLTTGNCAGTGGGVTGSGTNNHLAKFNGTGSAIGDSTLTDDGTTVTTTGVVVIQGGSATIGVANTQTGTVVLADGGSAFSGTITQGALTGAHTYTLPDATGTFCLTSGNCLGGGGGGGANASLSNLSSVAINTSLLSGSSSIDLGSNTNPFRDLYLGGTATNNFRFTGTASAARTYTLDDLSGHLALVQTAGSSSAQTGDINVSGSLIAGTALQGTVFKSADGAGASSATTFRSGNTTGGSGLSTGGVTIKSGDGSGTNTSSGAITLDAGSVTGSGVAGTIAIGGTNASAVAIGRSGLTTTTAGGFTVGQQLTANGTVSVGANQNVTLQSGSGVFSQSYTSAAASSAQTLSITNSNAGGSSIAVNGQDITLVGTATSGGTNTNSALKFENPTAQANNLFYGMNFVGTGYTDILRVNGTQIISGAGKVQNPGFDSSVTYSNLTQVGNLTAVNGTMTLGTTSQQGSLVLHDGNGQTATLSIGSALVANTAIALPTSVGTSDTICLLTLANCLGGAGGAANTALSNLTGVAINTSLLTGSSTIDLGSSTNPFRDLYLGGTATNNFRFTGTASTGRTYTLDDLSGKIALVQTAGGSSAQTGDINASGTIIAGTALQGTLVQTADGAGASSGITFRSGNTTGGSGLSTGGVTIKSGDGSGTNTSSGAVSIDSGSTTGSGTNGAVSIGTTNASAVNVGHNGVTTTNNGSLTVSQLLTASGGVSVAANQNVTLQSGSGTYSQTYSNTSGAAATFAATDSANSGATTLQGVAVNLTGTNNGSGSNTITGLSFGNVSAATNNTFTGIGFGTGFNALLSYNGTALVSGTGLLQNSAIDSSLTYSNLQKVGTINTGTWQGSVVAVQYGGTGAASFTANGVLYGNTTGAIQATAAGTTGQCFLGNTGAAPSWGACGGGVTLQSAYNASTDPELVLGSAATAGLTVRDNASPISGNLLEVQKNDGSITYFAVTTAGTSVTGTASATTALQAPTFDATASGALNIGKTSGGNATSINLNQNTVLPTGKTLTITGDVTANRPASPVDGMLYYDTTLHTLLQYNANASNNKWQADRTTATKTVAMGTANGCSGSSPVASQNPDAADYISTSCTSAQTVINNAISALPSGGGVVYLMEGTYITSGAITVPANVKLLGAGNATIIKLADSTNASVNMVNVTGNAARVQSLLIDQNTANQTSGTIVSVAADSVFYSFVQDVKAINVRSSAIQVGAAGQAINNLIDCTNGSVSAASSATAITITGTIQFGSSAVNNVIENCSTGIVAGGLSDTISGNTILEGRSNGINLNSVDGVTVTGNTVDTLSGNSNNIYASTAMNGTVTRGTITGNSFSHALNLLSFTSVSSTTISGNRLYESNNLMLSIPAGSNDTISGNTATDSTANQRSFSVTANDSVISDNDFGGVTIAGANNHIISNHINASGATLSLINLNSGANNNIVSDNSMSSVGGSVTGIVIASTVTNTYVSNNSIVLAGGSAISDSGTGTIYASQQDGNGNLLNTSQGGGFAIGASSASSSLTLQGGLVSSQLAAPNLSATVTNVGTSGATTYRYQVTALDGIGETVGSTIRQTTTGNATLSGTNYNTITWTAVGGAYQYNIYRCTGAACTPLKLATVAGINTSYNDQAAGSPSGAAPASNSTGGATFAGAIQGTSGTFTSTTSLTLGTASSATGSIVFNGSGGAGTLTLAGPTTPNVGNFTLTIPAITASANVCTDNSICSGYQSSATAIIQAPSSTAQNTITPTGSTTGLTVNGSSTATLAVNISQGQAADALDIGVSNGSSTANNGISLAKSGGGTLDSGLNVSISAGTLNQALKINQSGGTLTTGILFGGTLAGDGIQFTGTSVQDIANTGSNALKLFGTNGVTISANGTTTASIDTSGAGSVLLGSSQATTVTLGNANATTTSIQGGTAINIGTASAGQTINVGAVGQTGNINIGQANASTSTINIGAVAGGGFTQAINIGTSATASSTTNTTIGSTVAGTTKLQGGATSLSVVNTGATVKVTSSTAFQVQSGGSSSMLNVDSSSDVITLFSGSPSFLSTSWTSTNAINGGSPQARYGQTSVIANGYLYVMGGASTTNTFSTNTYYAKVNADGTISSTWNSGSALPYAAYKASSFVANGYIYYIGGDDGTTHSRTDVYYSKINADGSMGSWTATTSLSIGRSFASAIYLNGYLYIIGGRDATAAAVVGTTLYAKVGADGSVGSWSTATGVLPASATIARASAVAANGYIYLMGGTSDNTNANGKTTVYYVQPSTSTGDIGSNWSTSANSLPAASGRTGATAVVANSYVYYMGGIDTSSAVQTSIYTSQLPSAGGDLAAWATSSSTLSSARWDATSGIVNGYIYEIGGNSSSATTTSTSTIFLASTNRLQLVGSLDLVGLQGATLADSGSDMGTGATGGSLTAGNGFFVGGLQIQGQASFNSGVSILGALTVGDGTNNFSIDPTTHEPVLKGTARHTRQVTLSAEYPGAVMTAFGGSNSGTMTTDTTTSAPFRNYYKWTTSQVSSQNYDIFVKVPLPTDFSAMPSGQTICADVFSSTTSANTIALTLYDTSGTTSGTAVTLSDGDLTPSSTSTWQNQCTSSISGGTYAANGDMTFDFKLTSPTSGDVRIGDITYSYLSKY
ncbi:MAG TPA: hypothetical protein VLF91_06190 [Candidatus Saccharimonadales bacterium]|nr:hypothetical protein [Candidatus Saccharimonadales bacterium]